MKQFAQLSASGHYSRSGRFPHTICRGLDEISFTSQAGHIVCLLHEILLIQRVHPSIERKFRSTFVLPHFLQFETLYRFRLPDVDTFSIFSKTARLIFIIMQCFLEVDVTPN